MRDLTEDESKVLTLIQEMYGQQNRPSDIFVAEDNEACILIKDSSGSSIMFANITNLAEWRADGSITSDEALKIEWLQI